MSIILDEKRQSLFVDIIFIENRVAHVDKSPVCFEEDNLSERGISRVTNENERSPYGDEKINENLPASDNQEQSKNLRLYGDKNMEIFKKDSQTQRKTYFQEAIYILEEIKNRFLPKDSVNSKVRNKLDISRLKNWAALKEMSIDIISNSVAAFFPWFLNPSRIFTLTQLSTAIILFLIGIAMHNSIRIKLQNQNPKTANG